LCTNDLCSFVIWRVTVICLFSTISTQLLSNRQCRTSVSTCSVSHTFSYQYLICIGRIYFVSTYLLLPKMIGHLFTSCLLNSYHNFVAPAEKGTNFCLVHRLNVSHHFCFIMLVKFMVNGLTNFMIQVEFVSHNVNVSCAE
jgi:hypothetical protein